MAISSIQIDPLTGLRRTQIGGVQPTIRFDPPTDSPWNIPRPGAAPGATVGSSATGGGGGGGFAGFDFKGALTGDPLYQQMLADLTAQSVGDRAGLRSARQRAVINFGEVPDFQSLDQGLIGSDFASDIDDTTRQLASKNTSEGLSVAARIQKAYQDQLRSMRNSLAARGALRSGEFGHQLGEGQQKLKEAQYDSRENLLQFLSNYQAGFQQAERQRQLAQQGGLGEAYMRALELFMNSGAWGGGGGYGGPPAGSPQALRLNPAVQQAGKLVGSGQGGNPYSKYYAG